MTSQNRTNINDSGNFPNSEFASGAISFDDMSLDDLFDELDWPDDNTVPRPSGESARVPGPPRIGRIDIGARIDIAGLSKPPDPVAAPDSSSDISSLEKNLLDAQKEYYRRVVREEDKLILKKLFTNKKSLGPHEKKIFKKINFEHQKLFHIWNVEESLLACLEYKDLSRDDHRCVRDSCKDIISDFESNASQYEKLILGLAARGVSSSYHLFQGLFLHATRTKFSFDINSLIKLGKIILAKFKNNSRLHEQLTDFNFCKDRLAGFFPRDRKGKPLRINVKAIKSLISQKGSGIDDFTREVKIKLSNLLALKNEIESNYEFISYYYELKTLWYKSCMDRLTVMRKQNKIDDDVLELFGSIRSGFLDLKAAFLDRGINDFGPANCSYYELCSVVYMAAKFLNSVYFCSYNVTKARELDAQIRVLENYLGIRQWDIETS